MTSTAFRLRTCGSLPLSRPLVCHSATTTCLLRCQTFFSHVPTADTFSFRPAYSPCVAIVRLKLLSTAHLIIWVLALFRCYVTAAFLSTCHIRCAYAYLSLKFYMPWNPWQLSWTSSSFLFSILLTNQWIPWRLKGAFLSTVFQYYFKQYYLYYNTSSGGAKSNLPSIFSCGLKGSAELFASVMNHECALNALESEIPTLRRWNNIDILQMSSPKSSYNLYHIIISLEIRRAISEYWIPSHLNYLSLTEYSLTLSLNVGPMWWFPGSNLGTF